MTKKLLVILTRPENEFKTYWCPSIRSSDPPFLLIGSSSYALVVDREDLDWWSADELLCRITRALQSINVRYSEFDDIGIIYHNGYIPDNFLAMSSVQVLFCEGYGSAENTALCEYDGMTNNFVTNHDCDGNPREGLLDAFRDDFVCGRDTTTSFDNLWMYFFRNVELAKKIRFIRACDKGNWEEAAQLNRAEWGIVLPASPLAMAEDDRVALIKSYQQHLDM